MLPLWLWSTVGPFKAELLSSRLIWQERKQQSEKSDPELAGAASFLDGLPAVKGDVKEKAFKVVYEILICGDLGVTVSFLKRTRKGNT